MATVTNPSSARCYKCGKFFYGLTAEEAMYKLSQHDEKEHEEDVDW